MWVRYCPSQNQIKLQYKVTVTRKRDGGRTIMATKEGIHHHHTDLPIFHQKQIFPKNRKHISPRTFLQKSPSPTHPNLPMHLRENNNQSQHQGIYQKTNTNRKESIGASTTRARTVAKALNTIREMSDKALIDMVAVSQRRI
ncbi:hypothetical protein GBA52_010734 [Prunus armeniaca]|nr:hypothetical protein GBA52_010734 [Prunus armeniaca]